MKAYKRYPVPVVVNQVLAKVCEYDRARVHEYFAALWSVIDGYAEKLEQADAAVGRTLPSVLDEHEARLVRIENALMEFDLFFRGKLFKKGPGKC